MRNIFENIVKGVITSIIGTTVMVMTVIMLWTKTISFMWEGVLGLIVGCILLIAPKDIPKLIREYFKSKSNSADITPPNPPRPID